MYFTILGSNSTGIFIWFNRNRWQISWLSTTKPSTLYFKLYDNPVNSKGDTWILFIVHRAPVLVALALIESGMKYEDAVEFIRRYMYMYMSEFIKTLLKKSSIKVDNIKIKRNVGLFFPRLSYLPFLALLSPFFIIVIIIFHCMEWLRPFGVVKSYNVVHMQGCSCQ